jgi:hypothetical protein
LLESYYLFMTKMTKSRNHVKRGYSSKAKK